MYVAEPLTPRVPAHSLGLDPSGCAKGKNLNLGDFAFSGPLTSGMTYLRRSSTQSQTSFESLLKSKFYRLNFKQFCYMGYILLL